MANTGLTGPFTLSDEKIDVVVTKTSAGVYVLGYVKNDGAFAVHYVGRSDTDLNERLHNWVGEDENYKSFKASYFSSPEAAFKKECEIWHNFGGPEGKMDNEIHPDKPEDQDLDCPHC